MWNTKPTETPSISATPEHRQNATASQAYRPTNLSTAQVIDQASLGKGVVVKGEITGCESLFIDGSVEGSISLPDNHVTIGRNGRVLADITAQDIVVMGKVVGNITASNRLDIRAAGEVVGDVLVTRLSVEEGAFCQGRIEIRRAEAVPEAPARVVKPVQEISKTYLVTASDKGKPRMDPVPMTA